MQSWQNWMQTPCKHMQRQLMNHADIGRGTLWGYVCWGWKNLCTLSLQSTYRDPPASSWGDCCKCKTQSCLCCRHRWKILLEDGWEMWTILHALIREPVGLLNTSYSPAWTCWEYTKSSLLGKLHLHLSNRSQSWYLCVGVIWIYPAVWHPLLLRRTSTTSCSRPSSAGKGWPAGARECMQVFANCTRCVRVLPTCLGRHRINWECPDQLEMPAVRLNPFRLKTLMLGARPPALPYIPVRINICLHRYIYIYIYVYVYVLQMRVWQQWGAGTRSPRSTPTHTLQFQSTMNCVNTLQWFPP